MKRLEKKWFETFDELSDWLLDEDDIEVINIQYLKEFWYVYFWQIT